MKKRILSLLLAALMSVSALAACDNNEPVDDVENPNDQQVEDPIEGEEPSDDVVEGDENMNVMELNVPLRSVGEAVSADSPEKVLKLTTVSSGDSKAKQIIVHISEIQIPAGATLEYDVYLESDSVGLGIFELKVGNLFISADPVVVDEAGVGLDLNSSDISGLAYGRWYHRVFDLNVAEASSSKMVRFSAGGLTNGATSVCYYDNICIKDADGNVIFTMDEEFVANYELRQSKDITCTFEVVDDPAPANARLSAAEIPCVYESLGVISGEDFIEAKFTVDNVKSAPAIYVGDVDEACPWGVRGVVLVAKDGYLTLYNSAETVTELASAVILGMEIGKELGIKLEVVGNVVRGYWLDDMDGVEPWPEFELAVDGLTGENFGVMDVYGHGSTMKTVSQGKCAAVTLENSYTNPVLHDYADPDVLYYDGVYYMYGTMGPGYKVYSSTDLVNWEYRGQCMENNFWGWENNGLYWAPDVEYYNGKFYMVCSINQHLGIAVADSPLGPFIADETYLFPSTIDGHLFIDDDGQAYLYYVSSRPGVEYGIYGAKFDLETLQVDLSTEVCVINDTEKWETYDRDNIAYESQVCEGPYMLKHNGLYYITYSGSDYLSKNYAVGYGVSESPLGPFVKYEGNPIHIGNSTVYGTAHHTFTTSPDGSQLYIIYHQHKNANEVELRKISVDKARFVPTESGIDRLETYGPTTTPQPMPLG